MNFSTSVLQARAPLRTSCRRSCYASRHGEQVVSSAVIIERLRDESSDPSTGPYRDLVWGQPDGDGDTSSLSTSIDTLSGNPYLTLYELQGVTHNVTSNGVVTPVQPLLDGTSAQAVAEAIANGATVPTQPQQATEVAAMQHSKIDRANSVPLFPPEQQQAAQSDTASPEPPLPQQPSQPVQAAGSVQPGKAQRSRRRQQQPRSRAGWAAAPSPAAAAVSLEAALLRLEQAAQALRTSPPPPQHQGVQGEQTVPPVVQDTAQSVPRSHRRRRAAAAQAPTKQQADSSAAPEHPTAAPHTTSHTGHGSGPLQRIQQLAVADAPAALTLYKQHRDHLSKPHVVALWEWLGRYARHRSAAAAPSGAAAAGVLQLEWDALRLWGGLVEQTVFHTPRLTVADIERVLVVHRGLNGQLGSWFESGSGAIAGRGASTAGGEQYMAGPAATDAAAAAHAHAHQQAHPRPNRLHGVEDLHPFQAAAREARDPAAMWVCDMPASVTLSSPEPSPPPPDSYSLATQPLSPLPETQQAHTDSQQHAPVPDVHAASAAAATQEPVHHTVQHSQSNGSGSIPQHRTSTVQQRAAVTLPPGLGRASVQAFESALFTAAQPLFPAASLTQLTSLLRSAVQLQLRLPARVADGWWAAWWAASTPLVATGTPQCVVSLLRSVGYNTGDSGVGVAVAEPGSQQQPQQRPGRSRSRRAAAAAAAAATASAAAPPPAAMAAVLKAVQPLLAELPLQQLCQVAHAAATLSPAPPLAWRESLVRAVTAQFDSLDAPAYALTLHALGRMRHRPSDRWLSEFWESAATLLNDFTLQELSLLLRGAAYLSYTPDPSLQLALWQETIPLLRHVSVTPAPSATLARIEAESLTQIGWSVLVGLGIRPPRQWVAAWVGAMRRRCVDVSRGALAGRPGEQQRAADSVWGQARRTIRPLRAGPARRALAALAAAGVTDLPDWSMRFGIPLPPELHESNTTQPMSTTLTPQQPQAGHADGDSAASVAAASAWVHSGDVADGYVAQRRRLFSSSTAHYESVEQQSEMAVNEDSVVYERSQTVVLVSDRTGADMSSSELSESSVVSWAAVQQQYQ